MPDVDVLFLTKYDRKGASSRYRSLQYFPHLESTGIRCTHEPLFSNAYLETFYETGKRPIGGVVRSYLRRLHSLVRTQSHDLIVLEKELLPYAPAAFERLLGRLDTPYVVDYDDAVFHNYDRSSNPIVRGLFGTKIDVVMRNAAVVIAGNEYLATRAHDAGANHVEIVPTVIDLDRYPYAPPSAGEPFTIGWIGTPTTAQYVEEIAPALKTVCDRLDARVVLVGSGSVELPGVPYEVREWSEATEIDNIASFDVGIMPLVDTPWERGKCGFKLIQYMGCGKPVIASPVGVNSKLVTESEAGMLADDRHEWIESLLELYENPVAATDMGRRGREFVEDGYSLDATAPRLASILRSTALDIESDSIGHPSHDLRAVEYDGLRGDVVTTEGTSIAFFLPTLGGGGAERAFLNLAEAFADRDHDVRFVLLEATGAFLDSCPDNVDVVDLDVPSHLRGLPRLYRYLRSEPPDVLIASLTATNFIAVWMTKLAALSTDVFVTVSRPEVIAEEIQEMSPKHRLTNQLALHSYRFADSVIAVSEGVRTDLVRGNSLEQDDIEVIYNPVVSEDLDELAAEPTGHPWFDDPSTPVVLGVGRLVHYKGFDDLLEAFRAVRNHVDAKLVILGQGPERSALQRQADRLGVRDHVELPGFVDNPYRFMDAADVFVCPSHFEGFGIVIAEAMACGTPVVCTDCPGGPREVLGDGEYGRLVPVGDVDALADEILATLGESTETEALKDRAATFSVETIADEYESLIQEANSG